MIGRPLRRNGLSGHNGLNLSAVGVDFYGRLAVAANLSSKVFLRSISGCSEFVVKSREMWCEMRELRMGHTKRISHSEF